MVKGNYNSLVELEMIRPGLLSWQLKGVKSIVDIGGPNQ